MKEVKRWKVTPMSTIDVVSAEDFDSIVKELEGKLKVAVEALSFYADKSRYEGGNQRSIPGDKFTPVGFPYRTDVTRDHGAIAALALAQIEDK